MSTTSKTVLECPNCHQKVSVPSDHGKMEVTCPKCRTRWIWPPIGSTGLNRFEVRPKAVRNAIILSVGCGAFTLGGLWMLFSGENTLAGLLCVAFFGGGGIYGIPRMARRKVSMVLTAEGIEQRYPEGRAFIPWVDVEAVGIVGVLTTKLVGIRLSSYDHYLNEMSPEVAEFINKSLPYMKLMARGASLAHVSGGLGHWVKSQGSSLKDFGKVGSLAEALTWSRENYGYDLTLSWAELDRSPKEFVALLEQYRSRG